MKGPSVTIGVAAPGRTEAASADGCKAPPPTTAVPNL